MNEHLNNRPVENMSERELLSELLIAQKKANRGRKIVTAFLAAITAIALITALILVPRTIKTISNADQLITEGQASMSELEELIEGVSTLTDNTNALISDNTSTVTDVVSKIDGIDFDSLNTSIKSLSDILEPLAKFFNVF